MVELRYDTISFLTDYGHADESVGVVKSVLRSIAPGATVLDITHDIEPHDVRAGGLALARSAQYLVPGVVLAVVDPGVGTERKAIAVEVGGGQSVLVGPDNGLLAPAVGMAGGATRAVVLDNPEYHLAAPGPTFAGRDVFGPVAAHLCTGVPLDEVGTEVDPHSLLPGVLPVAGPDKDGAFSCEVLWVDRFGNAQLNVDPDDLAGWGQSVTIRIGQRSRTAQRARAYGDIPPAGVGLIVDSYGLLTVAVDRSSAADELGLHEGDAVILEPAPGPATRAPSPVQLTGKPTPHRPPEEHQ